MKNKMATKDLTLAAIVLCIKELTKYLYQQEACFRLRSRDLLETKCLSINASANQDILLSVFGCYFTLAYE